MISLNMIKNGSVSSASVQLTSSSLLQHQVRPQGKVRSPSRCSQGSVSKIRNHVPSRGSSQKGQCQRAHSTLRSQIIIASTLHHLQKFDFTHLLIWVSSFHSLSGILGSPLLSLSSSRFISILDKIHREGSCSKAVGGP